MILFANDLKPSQKVLLLQIEALNREGAELTFQDLAEKLGTSADSLRERVRRLQKKGYLVRRDLPRRLKLEVKTPGSGAERCENRTETSQKGNISMVTLNHNVKKDIYKKNVNVENDSTTPGEKGEIANQAMVFMTMIRDSPDNLNFWKQMVGKLGYETLCGYYGRAHLKRREIKSLPAYIISLLKVDYPELFFHCRRESPRIKSRQ